MRNLFSLYVILIFTLSCGAEPQRSPGENTSDQGEDAIENQKPSESENLLSNNIQLEIEADYTLKPADIIILRENSDILNSTRLPFSYRLSRARGDTPRGFMDLAVRLYFTEIDFQLGFLESIFNNDSDANTKSGHLLVGNENSPSILQKGNENLIDLILQRASISPGSEIHNGLQRNNAQYLYPLKSILNLINQTNNEESTSYGIIRDEAFLSIVYIGFLDEIKESTDTMDIISKLDSLKGSDNWMISVLAPPKEGCSYEMDDGSIQHTNSHRYAANSTDPEIYLSYQRKNKMLYLSQYSGGMQASICDKTYTDFMKNIATKGTENAFFTVLLETPPKQDTLKVTVEGVDIGGYKLIGSNKLLLPTSIKQKSTILITYEKLIEESIYEVEDSIIGNPIEDIKEAQLNPKEIIFLNQIRDIFQNNGCIGCHGKYGSFAASWADRDAIEERIKLDDSNPLSMPQNQSFDDEENKQILIDWINE